ncbi:MAG: M24 family metallopeptidase [bacterium]
MRLKQLLPLIAFFAWSTVTLAQEFAHTPSPWPRIRKERIRTLLPDAMKRAQADAWIVICRENNNDPLAIHVGGENAGGTAAFLFFNINGSIRSIAISPMGESTALKEIGLHDTVIVIPRGTNVWQTMVQQLGLYQPRTIAVNSSSRAIADGLSFTQRTQMEKELGLEWSQRLISSEEVVIGWLSVKLSAEIEIMTRAAKLTNQLEIEAYNAVIPEKTTDADVARFIKKRMKELGVEDGWAPDQNPSVNSGPDRGHSHSTDKVIQPGDVIQMDFGIKVYGIWCSDIQRFAYVLKKGETTAPPEIQKYWEIAKTGHRKVLHALRPGIRGYDADKVQRLWLKENQSLPIMWGTGHPVGYWAHDLGPALSGGQSDRPPTGDAARVLRVNQLFAYDGFYCWPVEYKGEKTTKTISVEEMAVINEEGACYLIEPQDELILIPNKKTSKK